MTTPTSSLQIVLGALLHDIGKFFERAELLGDYRNDAEQQQSYCPFQREKGYYSHRHVLHTLKFCELLQERIPSLAPDVGSDQNWLGYAARHHVSSTPLERLVAAADHFASAEREQGSYYEPRIHQKTRLEPLLERVMGHSPIDHRLPLRALSTSADDLYPKRLAEFSPPMKQQRLVEGARNEIALSPDHAPLVEEYRTLAKGLLDELKLLPVPPHESPESLKSLIRSLLALFQKYLSSVPAATNVCHPDISLFDHLRVTAAIAEGLYLWHEAQDDLNRARFDDRTTAKWCLVCGDFSGIQRFIYSITSKRAAKALRGRSLYVQLLCDAISERLLRRLNLSACCRIYSSGGKFFLLIPSHLEQALREEALAINRYLLQQYSGDVFLGIGMAPVCGEDFSEGNMGPRWKEAASTDLERDRQRRFSGLMLENPDFFSANPVQACGVHCQVCGKDAIDDDIQQEKDRRICGTCRDLEQLGRHLADASGLFWAWDEDRRKLGATLAGGYELNFGDLGLTLYLLGCRPTDINTLANLDNCHRELFDAREYMDGNPQGYSCGYRYLARWDRDKESGEWEFDQFSDHAKGVKRLGVLRMDVDNLGQLFVRGLRFSAVGKDHQKEMGSLSRMATLSRQLSLFFSGHLTELLQPFERSQVIYAGGDDLFLIGSWDELPSAADHIRRAFTRYTASNPAFSISGGLALVDGKFPISKAAELAGTEESHAKSWGDGKSKAAFSMLDTAMPWRDWGQVVTLKAHIARVAKQNRGIIDRLRNVVLSLQEFERRRLNHPEGPDADSVREAVRWQRWRWQLVYNLCRMVKRNGDLTKDIEAIQRALLSDLIDGKKSNRQVIEWLQMPLRWAELETRKEK